MSAILWILGLIGLVYGYSALWSRQTAKKLHLALRMPNERLIEGDETVIWLELVNTSWLPVPWAEVTQKTPDGLLVRDGDLWVPEMVYRTFLLPRQRVQRQFVVRCERRGLFKFDYAQLQYGDGIGLEDVSELHNPEAQLVVCPRPLADADIPVPMTELIGEQAVVRWYQEDASRLQGVRSYRLGDPFKQVHWAATARTGELMIKQFETTSETAFYIVMNHQFFEPYWQGTRRNIIDQQCRVAMTAFEQMERRGLSYGLFSNGAWAGLGGLAVPLERSVQHLDFLMDSLGAVAHRASGPFADLLDGLRGRLPQRATLVVMTAFWDERIAEAFERLRAEGHQMIIAAFDAEHVSWTGLSPAVPVIPFAVEGVEEAEMAEAEMLEAQMPEEVTA